MRKALCFVAGCIFIARAVFAQSVTITSPNGGESWELGKTQNITWTYSGIPNNTKVKLMLRKDGAGVGDIVTDIPIGTNGAGSFPWIVGAYGGGTAAEGQGYKLRIRPVSSQDPMDSSNQTFAIAAASAPPSEPTPKPGLKARPGFVKDGLQPTPKIFSVKILRPGGADSYQQLDTITIRIQANTGPEDGSGDGFDVDLHNEQGTTNVSPIHSGGIPQPSPGIYDLEWKMPRMDNVPDGKYTVWARSWLRNTVGVGSPFWIRIPGAEEKRSIPAMISGTWTWKRKPSESKPPSEHVAAERPGEARIGFYNSAGADGTPYMGIIYRARMHFPMDSLAPKKARFKKATLRLKQSSFGVRKNVGDLRWTIGRIRVLQAPWNDFFNTPTASSFWNVPSSPGPEWTCDITDIVRGWLDGTIVNHGLLLTACDESWAQTFKFAVSFYQGTIDLTFFNPVY